MSTKQPGRLHTNPLKPLPAEQNQPVFDEQWQAQALAMADLLIQAGHMNAKQWAQTLGKHLVILQTENTDNHQSYYEAVLQALQESLQQQALLTDAQIQNHEQAWKNAYLSTPHGQPVALTD